MRHAFLMTMTVMVAACALAGGGHGDAPAVSPDQAWQNLKQGNQRFTTGQTTNPNTDNSRRVDCAKNGQHPFAAVLTCADSRVPVERVFDQGIGDLFTVRIAGNVCDVNEIGSLEYAAEHLNTPLIVVMGHAKCGAVAAAASKAELPGCTGALVHKIDPAVAEAEQQNPGAAGDELLAAAIRCNVNTSIKNLLSKSETIRALVAADKVQVVGAVYNIESGQVEWLGPHPQQVTLTRGALKVKEPATADGHAADKSHD